jgi:hypothetical protein
VAGRELGDQVRGHGGRVGERLVEHLGQPREQLGDVLPKLIEISSAATSAVTSAA